MKAGRMQILLYISVADEKCPVHKDIIKPFKINLDIWVRDWSLMRGFGDLCEWSSLALEQKYTTTNQIYMS